MTKTVFRRIMIAILALFVTACGSSNSFSGWDPNYPADVTFAGSYTGSNALEAGQTSSLALTVAEDGGASGSLTVQNLPASAQATVTIPAGNYPVSGTVDMETGAFSLTGSFFPGGDFTIGGNLATGSVSGSYNLNFNGKVYSGTITPSAGAGGGGTPPTSDGDLYGVLNGVLSNLVSSPKAGYNGPNPIVTPSHMITGAVQTRSAVTNSISIAMMVPGATLGSASTLVVGVALHDGEDLEVGKTYSLADASGDGSFVSLSDTNGTTITKAWVAPLAGSGGSFTINSMTDTSIDVSFSFTNVGPNPEVTGNQAAGSFDVSGKITADLVIGD